MSSIVVVTRDLRSHSNFAKNQIIVFSFVTLYRADESEREGNERTGTGNSIYTKRYRSRYAHSLCMHNSFPQQHIAQFSESVGECERCLAFLIAQYCSSRMLLLLLFFSPRLRAYEIAQGSCFVPNPT